MQASCPTRCRILCLIPLLFASAFCASAQTSRTAPHKSFSSAEQRASHAFDAAVHSGPAATYAFLLQFPKGADLHVHLSGAVYAETFIRNAAEDGVCVDPVALKFARPPCAAPLVDAKHLFPVSTPSDQDLYDRLIDAFSMRGFVPSSGLTGHDQFFATFARFGGLDKRHAGEWVDEAARRADNQNQQYLELMQTPPFGHAATIARQINWPAAGPVDLAVMRRALLDGGLRDEVEADRADVRDTEARRQELEHCGTPQAESACSVQVRYIYQVLRDFPPEQVFAQTLLGFETIEKTREAGEPGFVGINFVQPEDSYLSMRDYTLQMTMLQYLHSAYPNVHISLHAGELAEGLVPPEGLRFHIRQAVELAHAERIGHGVDVTREDKSAELLKEMAARHIMVEINLSSNEGILGVAGANHPFPVYRAAHVPVALSTDDEGVSRIDITHEYERATREFHLSYADLKNLARTSMEHNFLVGQSLWAGADNFAAPVAACRAQALGDAKPRPSCKAFLDKSEKAAAQWVLERRLREFESQF